MNLVRHTANILVPIIAQNFEGIGFKINKDSSIYKKDRTAIRELIDSIIDNYSIDASKLQILFNCESGKTLALYIKSRYQLHDSHNDYIELREPVITRDGVPLEYKPYEIYTERQYKKMLADIDALTLEIDKLGEKRREIAWRVLEHRRF